MTSETQLYPLQFETIYKQTIWGGNRIYAYKRLIAPVENIGETWEISPMKGSESVIKNGPLKGENLVQLTDQYGAQLLGKHVYDRFGGKFPLLIKLIDANRDLSVQVHPGDQYAETHHNSWGKTEMWYILESTPTATIYAGWKKATTPEQLREIVKSDEVMAYLDTHEPHSGDVFYLPAGKVHTIGAGNMLLEIQQASDITYRLYDFNRTDAQGHTRELHIEDGANVVDYSVNQNGTEEYSRDTWDRPVLLVKSDYFVTHMLQMTELYEMSLAERDSFTVIFIEDGEVSVQSEEGTQTLQKGEFLLLPACLESIKFQPITSKAKIIETYVPKL